MQPSLRKERYQILDVLRGFALVGIITANMILYSLYLYLPETRKQSLETYQMDKVLDFLELVFVEGKFYTIFSILFGIGFSILLTRASQKGLVFYRFFLRRIFFLYLIGLAHAILIWHNDILTIYAICGALLLFFTRMSNRTILSFAAAILLLPIPIALAGGIHPNFLMTIRDALFQRFGFTNETVVHTFTTGNYWQIIRLNFSKWFDQIHFVISSSMILAIFGKFLLGFYIGKNQLYNELSSYTSLIRKIMIWGFAIGLPLNVLFAATEYGSTINQVIGTLGILPLSAAYVCVIRSLWLNKTWQYRLLFFAPVGRMALTNYVSQSIICTLIFYGTGLALGGKLGPAIYIPIGILVYSLQILLSQYWLKYFQYGPLEWIWRMLTYGKRLNIRTE